MPKYPTIRTPRGRIVVSKNMTAELKWNTFRFSGGGRSWFNRFSQAQKFVDSEVLRLCEPYIPLLTGMLIASGILGTHIGSGLVKWIAPYAKAQYYMVRKNPSKTGPLRGPYWFERMKQIYRKQIVAGAAKIFAKE